MSKSESRSFNREFKLGIVGRIKAEENLGVLARELKIRRAILYRWRDSFRLGGPGLFGCMGARARPRRR